MPRGYYPKPSAVERFWSMVKQEPNGCWLWQGSLQDGYGRFSINKRHHRAHRVSYEWEYGPISSGLEVDHLCRIRSCIRPSHLEAVTPKVNARRSDSPAGRHSRQILCQRGHEFNGTDSKGNRICRTCKAAKDKSRLQRLKVDHG